MAFWGNDGDLGTIQAAQNALIEIANKYSPEFLEKANNPTVDYREGYDAVRIMRQIEGLQNVILRNGGVLPHSWLPHLSKATRSVPTLAAPAQVGST